MSVRRGNREGNPWFSDSFYILQVSHCYFVWISFAILWVSYENWEGFVLLPQKVVKKTVDEKEWKEREQNQQVAKEFRWSNRNIFAILWNEILLVNTSSAWLGRVWVSRRGEMMTKPLNVVLSKSYLISFGFCLLEMKYLPVISDEMGEKCMYSAWFASHYSVEEWRIFRC